MKFIMGMIRMIEILLGMVEFCNARGERWGGVLGGVFGIWERGCSKVMG